MADIKIQSTIPIDGIHNKGSSSQNNGSNFADVLKSTIDEVNTYQKSGEKTMADLASGQIKDVHQAAITLGKAEHSMKLMLEIRNKAISAYKEILRTQV